MAHMRRMRAGRGKRQGACSEHAVSKATTCGLERDVDSFACVADTRNESNVGDTSALVSCP
jgi:hypothetical protein